MANRETFLERTNPQNANKWEHLLPGVPSLPGFPDSPRGPIGPEV